MLSKYLEYIIRKCLNKLTLRVILIFRVFWGHVAYLNDFNILSFLAKLYCFILGLIIPLTGMYVLEYNKPVTSIIESATGVWLSFAEAASFSRFSDSLERIDGFRGLCHPSDLMYFVFFLIVLFRTFVAILFLYHRGYNDQFFWIISFLLYVVDFGHVMRMLIFDIIYVRVKLIRTSFENTFIDVTGDPVICENIARKVKNIMLMYKQLQDSFRYLGRVQATFFAVLLIRFVLVGTHLNISITFYKETNREYIILFDVIHETIYGLILACLPILFFELALNEVEKILSVLERQLQRYTDATLLRQVETAIRYLQLRPFRFRIWRVFEVDTSLPLSYLSFIFTFVILLLQVYNVV